LKICNRGCGNSRDLAFNPPEISEIENYVFNKECNLGLNKVNFETFMGAVKRFGYKNDLNQ
jgi:hypothetical protein